MAKLVEVGGAPVNRSEREVIARLTKGLPDAWRVIPNVDIHDGRAGHAYECDAIVIGPPGVCIVEIKGWRGTIRSRTHADWQLDDGKFVTNPLKVTDHKARVLASHIKSLHLRHGLRPPWVSACLVVDDPRATFEVFPPEDDRCLRIDTIVAWLTTAGKLASPRGRAENYARYVPRICDHVVGRLGRRTDADRRYGNFRTTTRVGGDDESAVWLARHAHLEDGRVYRVRTWFLSPYLLDDEQRRQRKVLLQRAAEALSRIGDHPNIAQLRDFGEQEGEFYEVTDWSESGTLATAHSGGQLRVLDLSTRVGVVRGLLEAVRAGAAHGVIHRDLSPSAVLLDPDGTPRVTDYDRAFITEAEGTVYGARPLQSNPYRAPELAVPGLHEAAETSDLYSVASMTLGLLETDDFPPALVDALRAAADADPGIRPKTTAELLAVAIRPEPTVKARFELVPGARIDGNTIIEQLGAGRDGRVFRVRNDLLQADYALKVLDSPREGDDPLAAWRHAKAARSQHLRSVHWVGTLPDGSERSYILLELVRGRTLREHLDEHACPALDEVLGWAEGVLDALAALHPAIEAPGVIHRDIKPANILIAPRGAVVVDLSLASPANKAGANPVGSPRYHPPDLSEIGWNPGADLFALGCVLYEALAGVHPWADKLPSGGTAPRSLQEVRPKLPAAVVDLVERALRPSGAERFPTAEEMADALAAAREASAPPPTTRTDLGQIAAEAADTLWAAGQVQRLVEHEGLAVPLFSSMRRCVVPAAGDGPEAIEEALLGTAARLHALESPLPELLPGLYDELLERIPPRAEDAEDSDAVAELQANPCAIVLLIDGLHPVEWPAVERRVGSRTVIRHVWSPGATRDRLSTARAGGALEGIGGRTALDLTQVTDTADLAGGLLVVELPTGDRRVEDLATLMSRRAGLLDGALDLVELHDGPSWVVATNGCAYLGHGLRADVAEGQARSDDLRACWATAFGPTRVAQGVGALPSTLERPTRSRGACTWAIGRLAWPSASDASWLQSGGLSLPEALLPIWFVPTRRAE